MQKTPEKETSNVHERLSVYKPFVSHSNSFQDHLFIQTISSFEQLGYPFVTNINPFKRLGHLFVATFSPFKWLGHPFIGKIRPFERLGHPIIGNIILFEQLGNPFIWNIGPFKLLGHLSVPFKKPGHYWTPLNNLSYFPWNEQGCFAECQTPNESEV